MFKSIWNYIKLVFKKPSIPSSTPSEPSKPYEPKTGLRIGICLGHSFTGSDKGAYGNGTNEVEYNSFVMDYLQLQGIPDVRYYKARNSLNAAYDAKREGCDIIIQLHLNAYNGDARGCEVLVIDGDVKSYAIAEKFAKEFTGKFNRVMRRSYDNGKKMLSSRDRGVSSLVASGSAQKILVEPFFIDNVNDFVPKEEYAEFLLEFIKSLR